jgi:hypothetical protein
LVTLPIMGFFAMVMLGGMLAAHDESDKKDKK